MLDDLKTEHEQTKFELETAQFQLRDRDDMLRLLRFENQNLKIQRK